MRLARLWRQHLQALCLRQKLQCRLSAPYILVACDGGLQRKKINTDDHLSMCNCSGGTELDKAVKFRISRSAWCTFSRGNKYAGTYPAKMSTVVLIFADGAQIRARICAPMHVYAGGTHTLLHRHNLKESRQTKTVFAQWKKKGRSTRCCLGCFKFLPQDFIYNSLEFQSFKV